MSFERETIREELSAYLDGELPQAEAGRIEQALKADPSLAAELESLRSVRQLLRQLPREKAPAGMAEKVIARAERAALLAGAGQAPARGGGWVGRLAVAASVLVVVGIAASLVVLVGRPFGQGPTGAKAPRSAEPGQTVAFADRGRERALGEAPAARPAPPPPAGGPARAALVPLNFVINTDNLLQAQREVESVFRSNSLLVVSQDKLPTERSYLGKVDAARGNFYSQTASTPTQVRYEVVIAGDQLRQIVQQLNAIRARQNVAQIPMEQFTEGLDLAMGGNGRKVNGISGEKRAVRFGRELESEVPRGDVSSGTRYKMAPATPAKEGTAAQLTEEPKARELAGGPATLPAQPAETVAAKDQEDKLDADSHLPESGAKLLAETRKPVAGLRLTQAGQRGPAGRAASQPAAAQAAPGSVTTAPAQGRAGESVLIAARARGEAPAVEPATTAPAKARVGFDEEYAARDQIAPAAPTTRPSAMQTFRMAMDQQAQTTTFAGTEARQLVVILNGVAASGASR